MLNINVGFGKIVGIYTYKIPQYYGKMQVPELEFQISDHIRSTSNIPDNSIAIRMYNSAYLQEAGFRLICIPQ